MDGKSVDVNELVTQEKNTLCDKLKPSDKRLIESVTAGSSNDVRQLLAEGVTVDCQDEHGMTPLQHAAYKGHYDLCELLLNHGADVNTNAHEHGYTPLMFAALSGKKEVVRLLLERGACAGLENAIHRTASQMAAFVGQHEIVSLINNFFAREDLDYYCRPHGLETEPKLPASLAPVLYRFILIVNLNPVKLSLFLRDNIELLKQSDRIVRVLDLLCEKMMKQRETNEILAVKFSYLSYIVKQAALSNRQQCEKSPDLPPLSNWIRFLLRPHDANGALENQEQLVRAMLKEFPYVECQIIQQMIRTITSSHAGMGTVTAVHVLSSCINGQRFGSADDKPCATCAELNAKTCQTCKSVHYCSKDCQKLHWFVHKKACPILAAEYSRRQQLEEQQAATVETDHSQASNTESSDRDVVSES